MVKQNLQLFFHVYVRMVDWLTMSTEAARELVKKRWDKTSKRERRRVASEISTVRWEQWRAENPEKAAASEERRRKRRAKGK